MRFDTELRNAYSRRLVCLQVAFYWCTTCGLRRSQCSVVVAVVVATPEGGGSRLLGTKQGVWGSQRTLDITDINTAKEIDKKGKPPSSSVGILLILTVSCPVPVSENNKCESRGVRSSSRLVDSRETGTSLVQTSFQVLGSQKEKLPCDQCYPLTKSTRVIGIEL